jgi:integrase
MAELRQQNGIHFAALEVAILSFARVCELLAANWDEFDFADCLWDVPAEHRKYRWMPRRIPLSDPLMEILKNLQEIRTGDLVFSDETGRPLGRDVLFRRLGHGKITMHGVRSSFCAWVRQRTHIPQVVAKMALGRALSYQDMSGVDATHLFAQYRQLMDHWGCSVRAC